MNLKYRILWVEDDTDWVESEIEFIESYLKKYGFILEYKNPEKYEKYDFSKFDIIVVDYELADEEQGQDVIEKIRKQELYTEILFYSQYGEGKLRKIIAKKERIDGVYCASKDNYIEKLKRLIYTTIRKTQDLNNLRGLVMAETSELDEMIREILNLLAEKGKVKQQKIIERKQKLIKRYKENDEDLKKYSLPDEFQRLLKSRHFDASFLLRTLLIFATCDKNSLTRDEIELYQNIQQERNNLAHNPEDSSTSTLMRIKKSDGTIIPYDEPEFIKIRKDIHEYKRIFQKIIDDLNA
ncbi:MAG: response regulator [Candidatus Aenigmarchaeota archaeon]|nr:response regulator [Candidatus Aenigmarchaeota archaeon]